MLYKHSMCAFLPCKGQENHHLLASSTSPFLSHPLHSLCAPPVNHAIDLRRMEIPMHFDKERLTNQSKWREEKLSSSLSPSAPLKGTLICLMMQLFSGPNKQFFCPTVNQKEPSTPRPVSSTSVNQVSCNTANENKKNMRYFILFFQSFEAKVTLGMQRLVWKSEGEDCLEVPLWLIKRISGSQG